MPRPPCNDVLITGPSGVGKGTLIKMLMAAYPDSFGFSVSHTTRGPRPGEVDGVDYHFVAKERFEELLKEDAFVEHAHVHGNYYGTSKAAVEAVRQAGRACILDIDVEGAKQVHAAKLDVVKIFIKPPSREQLRDRLEGRGTETQEKVELRLHNATRELDFAEKNEGGVFDHFVVNDGLEDAFQELKTILGLPEKSD
eukprot:EG_transcript_20583